MDSVSSRPKVLVFGAPKAAVAPAALALQEFCEVVAAEGVDEALQQLRSTEFTGVCVFRQDVTPASFLLEFGGLLQQIPDGIVLLDAEKKITWWNDRFEKLTGNHGSLKGADFLQSLGDVEIIGPEFCPLDICLATKEISRTTLKIGEKFYYQIDTTPVFASGDEFPSDLLVMVRDLTAEMAQRLKLTAIHQAGQQLGDMNPEDVRDLTDRERIDLMKSKILHFTKSILEFETVEIRLIDKATKRLKPLLEVGMDPQAANRCLYASAEGNGVTGFVAATGRSYLCKDTNRDKLYLPGALGATSSLTVPLMLHDEVIGTFNVESPEADAFSDNDLMFLELFCRQVANALNTLDLLTTEQVSAATETIKEMLCEVAAPADELLNDAAWLLEQAELQGSEAIDRIQRIVEHAREIRGLMRSTGKTLSPELFCGATFDQPFRPILRDKRVLVAEPVQEHRRDAHDLLGRFGCIVETAPTGADAIRMAKEFPYDLVLSSIKYPDLGGTEVFRRIKEFRPGIPIIVTSEYGWDSGHTLANTHVLGRKYAIIKPFKLDQLLKFIELSLKESLEAVLNANILQ